ncbi:MAG: hypothetical protein IMF11_09980 [Proteobacteria bacterium]|nr:hypothetical protein [Pseudomonadota bacterium]
MRNEPRKGVSFLHYNIRRKARPLKKAVLSAVTVKMGLRCPVLYINRAVLFPSSASCSKSV